MQLKELAKVSAVTKTFNDIVNSGTVSNLAFKATLEGISNQEKINIVSQSALNETQKIGALASAGLTAEELKQTVQTGSLAASQATTTTTTLGLGTAFKGLGIKIKQATVSMWKFLTTNPLGWATLAASAIAALAFGVKKYNDSIEEAKESARERTSELFDEFKQMNDTLSDHKKTVSDLADRYDELSKGVNLSNNKNVSLSTGEYEEFLDINEQLTQSFPELSKGIDENGNSILTLGTKGITAKEQLEELLQTEEDLNNFRIAQGLEDAFKGVYIYVEDANKATENLNGSINDSSEAMNKLQDIAENGIKLSGDNGQLIFGGDIHNEAELNYMNSLTDSVNEFWESLDGSRRVELAGFGIDSSTLFRTNLNSDTGIFEIYADTYQLTPEELTALESIIQDNVGDASSALLDSISDRSQELQEQIQKGENAWTDFIPTLVSGMKSKQTFKNLDSDLQNIAVQIVEGLDYSYADAMKEWDPDPYAYVRDKIIDPLSKLDDAGKEKLTSSFEELFKLDADDLSQSNQAEIEKFITTIANLLDKDPIEIRVALGFDVEDIQNRYNTALNKAKHQLGGYDYNDRGVEATNDIGRSIQDFWDENVTTEEDWTLWQKVTDGITDATEAMNAYAEAKKNANGVEIFDDSFIPTISSSVQQLANQLEPQFAKLGEAYKAIFTDDGFTLDDVDNSMLEELRKSFAEIEEEIGVTFDSSKLEPFFDALTDSSSTSDQVQQAFNDLATAYFYSTETLGYLNEETAESIIKQLEEMGVANAQEVVYDALKEKTEELALEKQFLAETGKDVADATQQDIDKYVAETIAGDECAQELMVLALKKAAVNGVLLDTSADITNLLSLAKAAGIASDNLILLANAKSGLALAEKQGNESMVSYYTGKIEELGNKAKEDIFNFDKIELDFKGATGGKKSGGGSGSSKDAWKEAYDAELKELEHMHKLGLISDEEYWKARMDLNEKYFGESSGMHEKYLDEYQENEEDILEGLKKLWEDYYNDRKNNLKDLISYAEKLYDREIDSLEANIKQIEEKRDTEKKYWQGRIDAIGDEIDALEDANDQRERAIDLQEKQYQLQKAMHQRTILLYSESKGMHYVNDSKAERSAKNDLDGAENDNKIADLKKQQKDLEKQLDAILETYDSQIESIEKQIDSLKEVKSAWSEIVENQEFKELEERLKSLFGDDIKSKILSGNTDFINDIIAQYSDTSDMLRTIEDATLSDIQNMVAQYGILPENLVPISNAAADIANTLANVDTSGFNANMNNTAQSSSNAAEKVQNVTTALNNLSNDVSNYQMPAINTDNFTSAFTEDGGILTTLNGFMERYKEICDGIPEIWNSSLAEAFGQGGGNGDPLAGGLANDIKYDALFDPLVEALDNCKTNMEAKLKECLGVFSTFQADLSGVIGVGGGSEESGSSQSGAEGGKGKGSGGKGKGSGGDKKSESGGGSDTIVGAIVEGGELIDQALNGEEDSWSASFNTAKESIHETATSIVDCIESMVETVVNACIKAIEAINMLASADDNNPNNPTPSPYGKVGHAHAAGINGTKTDEKDAIVSEYGQREMTIFPNGKTVITDSPTAMDLPKGSVVYNEEQTEKILKNKVTATGNAHADGTDADGWITLADGRQIRPLQPGDSTYDMMQKVNAYLKRIDGNVEKLVPNSFYERNREMNELADQINYVSSITNNRNVQPSINIGDINVTCPGVTSQEVMHEVGDALNKQIGHLSQRAMQEAYKR